MITGMIKKILFFILICWSVDTKGQMNFQDSSVQVITFWNVGEVYNYSISLQKLKFAEKDTTSNETITYDVEVSVIDSAASHYIVRWLYKNYKTNSSNPFIQKVISAAEDIAVDIKINELGEILSVENWEGVRDYMAKSFEKLKNDIGSLPGLDRVMDQMKGMYSTKASIEAMAIQDAIQFHNFYGGKYYLHKKEIGQSTAANAYDPSKPFDIDLSVVLEKLDEEKSEYVMRSIQTVNPQQLSETIYKYLSDVSKNLGEEMFGFEEMKEMSNTLEIVSFIHNTGWVLESVSWKEIVSEGITNMEIRRIIMK